MTGPGRAPLRLREVATPLALLDVIGVGCRGGGFDMGGGALRGRVWGSFRGGGGGRGDVAVVDSPAEASPAAVKAEVAKLDCWRGLADDMRVPMRQNRDGSPDHRE